MQLDSERATESGRSPPGRMPTRGFTERELTELAEYPSQTVRQLVAATPDTPVDVLEGLAVDFPGTALGPLRFLGLSEPDVWERLGVEARASLAGFAEAPSSLLERFAEDPEPEVRSAVASNAFAPQSVLARLEEDVDDVRASLASNWALSERDILSFSTSARPDDIRTGAGRNPALPEVRMVRAEDFPLQLGVAANPNAPETLLQGYASARAVPLREAVASNRGVGVGPLLQLAAMEGDRRVRLALARNPQASGRVLECLHRRSSGAQVPAAIAAHPNTPESVLLELSTSGATRRGRAVVSNESAPPCRLREFARHRDAELRRRVAGNPAAPVETLRRLAADDDRPTALAARLLLDELHGIGE